VENKKILIWIVIIVWITGCISINETTDSEMQTGNGEYPLTITDDLGRNVTIIKEPQRIISLAPSTTEILFALGLGDRIVGVTEECDYPSKAMEKPKVGGFHSTYNMELIINSAPDLVLASSMMRGDDIKKLEGTGITVPVMAPKNVEEILGNIKLIGDITGKEKKAENLTKNMRGRIDKVKKNAENLKEKPKVVYVIWHEPLMSAGKGTFANNLIEIAGGENIYSDTGIQYPEISLESVIDRNPDILIVPVGHGTGGNNLTYEYIIGEPRLRGVNAVKNGRVYGIDTGLSNRPGPRIVDGLEHFAEWIQEG